MTIVNDTVVDAADAFRQGPHAALIKAAQVGDKAAYNSLYNIYSGKVYAMCYRLTGEKALAEDATQEVFIQLWRKLNNFSFQSQFTTWLQSVAANVTITYMRKQYTWWQRVFSLEDSDALSFSGERGSEAIDLEGYIIRLPERARIVFVLHAVEGFRHEEIAKMLKMAEGTSKAQFHRAKQLLKEWMGEDNG